MYQIWHGPIDSKYELFTHYEEPPRTKGSLIMCMAQGYREPLKLKGFLITGMAQSLRTKAIDPKRFPDYRYGSAEKKNKKQSHQGQKVRWL